ncbi:MAG TPA: hypothetical protein VFD32_15890 [Dehalococcoidia bacterium]|nr:hypothetical protein [Dehalococcoidia bacterium]
MRDRTRAAAFALVALLAVAATGTPAPTTAPLHPIAVQPGQPVQVAVYADSRMGMEGSYCSDLLLQMVPASAAGRVRSTIWACTVGIDYFRFHYVQSTGGPLYLASVDILVPAKATLPVPTPGGRVTVPYPLCRTISSHLFSLEDDPGRAAYLSLCQVEPIERGRQFATPLVIWARLPDDSPVKRVQPNTPCWTLEPYLGPPREVTSFNVPCALDAGLLPPGGPASTPAKTNRLALLLTAGSFALCAAVLLIAQLLRRRALQR